MRDAEAELMPAMRAYGLGLLPYFPLASGLLTGKYRRNAPMPENARLTKTAAPGRPLPHRQELGDQREADRLRRARGHTALELAFSWLLRKPPVASVIAGATKPEQLEQNAAAGAWQLTAEELTEVEALTA